MKVHKSNQKSRRRPVQALAGQIFIVIVLLITSFAPVTRNKAPLFGQRALAQNSNINLVVNDAQTGATISNFRWMVNLDNTHDNASLIAPASFSPVIAEGDQSNASGIVLDDTAAPNHGYLVTVLANDGVGTVNDPDYKIGGKHFRLPQEAGDIVVELQPNPLPLSTIKVRVFHDNHLTNSEDDIPLEDGLAGFHIVLADRVGEVTTNWFGDPICTEYAGTPPNDPIPGTGGFCVTGPDGIATIKYMGSNRFEVEAIPPDGTNWIQTTTIEGTKAIDAWVEEGSTGFSTEEGFLQALVWFGFVQPCSFGNTADDCPSNNTPGTGTITGRIRSVALDNEAKPLLLGNPVPSPFVSLNNIGGNDEQVYTARGNADGTFTIPSVPPGLYQLVVWDLPLDYIIQFFTVQVGPGQTVNLGDLGIPPWFGKIRGSVYIDTNENGIRDPGEVSLRGQDLDTRFKDGTIQYTTFSDNDGNYVFPEVFELEHFAIAEVGYGRFKQTGAAAYQTDQFGNPVAGYPDNFVNQDLGLASLLQAEITWAGTTNYIDWGKKAFALGENGGIVGIIFNATTRNELNARLQANEDYEPGVPGAVINLYDPVKDGSGSPVYDPDTGEVQLDHIVGTYIADSWYDALPTDCIEKPSLGRPPGAIQPSSLFPNCLELPALLEQVKSGVFDGGYAFEEDCSDPNLANPDGDDDNDGVPNRLDPDLLSQSCVALPAGDWVVGTEPPPGYRSVMEEDINVFSGDQLVPAIPPPPCAGLLHTVHVTDDLTDANFDFNDPVNTMGVYNPDFLATTSPLAPNGGSPYEGQQMPLCNRRLVTLETGQNANSDFFLFTDALQHSPDVNIPASGAGIPMPGRIRGVLLDDLTLELDPSSPLYGDKRGIPNAPVGIRDFTGELITTVYSDANGSWEVLLPSTGTYNCPVPAGPCPGMYRVTGNDPGTPQNPNQGWNPNYGTLQLVFDVWPGLTTYADVAILPITGFVQGPNSQFETPPICEIPDNTPDIQSVSQPYGSPGDDITIVGTGFGSPGSVTLDGTMLPVINWTDTAIDVELAGAEGPHQLLLTNDGGATSPLGATIHVLGAGYNPPMIHVPGDHATIQGALEAANDGDLILVHPGVYFETLLVDERVKLQGYGPGASVIDGRFFNFGGTSANDFAQMIADTVYDGPATVPMGQVITVLAEQGEFDAGSNAQIDGFAIRGGTRVRGNVIIPSQGGGVYLHAYAKNLVVSNNLIQSNAGNMGGGVILGQAYVTNPDAGDARDNENDNVRLHHNRILNNGGVSLAGSVGIFNGAENYTIDHNVVCGNYSAEYGGGISNYGYSSGRIHDNQILFNYAFDEGGGVMVAGEQPIGNPLGLSAGTGAVVIERNRIQGNVSNDDGGGVRLLQPVDGRVTIQNNMVVNNLATDSGGGIALDDALDVRIVNNTVARNISTATAEDADRTTCNPPPNGTCPHGAGLVSEQHSAALLGAKNPPKSFSDPVLFNNIIWENQAYYLDGTITFGGGGLPSAGIRDLEVLGGGNYSGVYNDCTTFTPDCPNNGNNLSADPAFNQAVTTDFAAFAFTNDPTFVTVLIRSTPGDPQGDYHVPGGSPVVDTGTANVPGVGAPCDDFDFDGRPNGVGFDVGADEQPGLLPNGCAPPPPPPPPPVNLYFSTQDDFAVPGVASADNANIYGWNGVSFNLVFQASGAGGAGLPGNANIDALQVVDADTFYMSFNRNQGTTVPGLGNVQDEDIVVYDAGVWSLVFDGSDVGLGESNAEDVDAFAVLPDGAIAISTEADPDVPGVQGERDEDLLRCLGTLGPATTCTWSMYFDGSDVGLANSGAEDVDGAAVKGSQIYLSTLGGFNVPGLQGGGEDVFVCNATSTGGDTVCSSFSLYFDGSTAGIANGLDAIDIPGRRRGHRGNRTYCATLMEASRRVTRQFIN
ncbi:MAG TPA: hypothetical protein VI776_13940 [Anaerolineales bacterium]|nr:hypothetical protein [Anaerolineales bacterium]